MFLPLDAATALPLSGAPTARRPTDAQNLEAAANALLKADVRERTALAAASSSIAAARPALGGS